jgi:hypothetical protein
LMGSQYVAITDNADPMNVVVYLRPRAVTGSRTVCVQPVFSQGASATDQSLIGTGRSLVVENNYGYSGLPATEQGATTTPGLERVDLNDSGTGCHRVWHNDERAPSVVPKLSLANGLVYTYTKPPRSDGTDAWYLTAIDFRKGTTAWKRLAGTGLGFNNNFAPVTLGPDGSAYVGALGGLIRLHDGRPPSGPPASAQKGCRRKARLKLRLRYRRGPRGCAREPVVASVIGRDRRRVRRAAFFLGRRRVAVDRHAPFRKRVGRRHRGRAHRHHVTVRVLMASGRRVTLRKRFRACGEHR